MTLATRKSAKIPLPPSNSRPKAAVSLALKVIHDWKNIENLLSVPTTVESSEINNNNKVDNLEFSKLGGHILFCKGRVITMLSNGNCRECHYTIVLL